MLNNMIRKLSTIFWLTLFLGLTAANVVSQDATLPQETPETVETDTPPTQTNSEITDDPQSSTLGDVLDYEPTRSIEKEVSFPVDI
jgi:hypothetical protein